MSVPPNSRGEKSGPFVYYASDSPRTPINVRAVASGRQAAQLSFRGNLVSGPRCRCPANVPWNIPDSSDSCRSPKGLTEDGTKRSRRGGSIAQSRSLSGAKRKYIRGNDEFAAVPLILFEPSIMRTRAHVPSFRCHIERARRRDVPRQFSRGPARILPCQTSAVAKV